MSFESTVEAVTIVEGVEVDITVRDTGGGEERASKTMQELKVHCGRIGAAYEHKQPPTEFEDLPVEYLPPLLVDWESTFSEDGNDN